MRTPGPKKRYRQTEEHRKKIGESNKRGSFRDCLYCGEKFWMQPYEAKRVPPRKYCNRACFKEYYRTNFSKSGAENRFWKNGSWPYWRREALNRDDYTCSVCSFREPEIMEVDHIKERHYGGINTLANLQTLCPNCHRRKTNLFLKTKVHGEKYLGK
jgi:hypothetical protein